MTLFLAQSHRLAQVGPNVCTSGGACQHTHNLTQTGVKASGFTFNKFGRVTFQQQQEAYD